MMNCIIFSSVLLGELYCLTLQFAFLYWIYVNTLDSNLSFYFFFYYLGIQNIKLLRFSPDSKSYIPKQLYKFARTPLESYS